ncbi:MAG: virulence protein RhuM/Fic/DOC family protein [Patescibacteria group bacterium]
MNKFNAKKISSKDEIVIYKAKDGLPDLVVKMEKETIWLTLNQIASLFVTDKSGISRHISNIFKSGELSPMATVAKIATVQKEGGREIVRQIEYYNLDAIISVGYRVNSKRATQFRIWATNVLKSHIIKGYTINEKRLKENKDLKLGELEKTVNFLQRVINNRQLKSIEAKGLLKVITDYANSWIILQRYDEQKLEIIKNGKVSYNLNYDFSVNEIKELKKKLIKEKQATDIFGRERENSLAGIVRNLEQTFGGKNLYPTIEERAAHLLYFVIKDHPFIDGNKRIGSFLFILFLVKNNYLYNKKGEKKINDGALASLALLIAESDPKEKNVMVALITNLLIN